ncbi:dynamin family protein [Corynebacterium breve]|uniref:Dynamin family protein n=1 Tax=Corynebacterium breve TaxID=3049799 RepID=A0ABY8VCT0_9CORY|nr:dynamin family protein [Corynebacterium breve]WIM67259.1 dynamin family protein [Corynebacterium breve]
MADTPARPAGRTAQESVERAADIASRYGLKDAANHATSLVKAQFKTGSVVVIGEIKRGKSSLVSALAGQRNLLPSDAVNSTSVPMRVRFDDTLAPDATPVYKMLRGDDYVVIDRDEVDKWGTQDEVTRIYESGNTEEIDQLPSAIEITVPSRDMGTMTVVDTPGVGGLDKYAIDAAIAESKGAGVLLMVCDASTPITAPEIDILKRGSASAGAVIVVVTKTDKNIRRFRDIVADDARLIREHLGAEVPVVGVSSLRALDATDIDDPLRRGEIERRSGITELRHLILSHSEDVETQGVLRAVESIGTTMTTLLESIERDLLIHTQTSEAVERLENERAELEKVRDQASEWEQLFQRDMSVLRNQMTEQLDLQLDSLRQTWTTRISSEGMRVLRSKPQVFTSQMEVDVRQIMEQTIGALIQEIRGHAAAMFPNNPEVVDAITQELMRSVGNPAVSERDVEKKSKDLFDPQLLTLGVVGAGVLSAIVPIAPLAGAAWIGVNLAYRAMRNGKQHLLSWLRDTTMTVRGSTTRMMDTLMTTARTEIMLRHRANLREQIRQLQAAIEEARDVARSSEQDRKQKVARLTKNRDIVQAMRDELNTHAERVSARKVYA